MQVPGQPAPIFNEPTSFYTEDTIPRSIILQPYPQFQALYSYTPFTASALYNSLQIRFEKRYSQGLSFTGKLHLLTPNFRFGFRRQSWPGIAARNFWSNSGQEQSER